jgi:hypothetical protein
MEFNRENFRITNKGNTDFKLIGAGIVVVVLSAIGYFIDSPQFFMSYLVAWIFWVSIGLGALFFVMLNHLTGAVWSQVLRRINESVMITLPYMAIFFIPLIFGLHDIYHWSHADVMAEDPVLSQKAAYLNVPFFLIRTALYFGIWSIIARKLYKTSIAQDSNPTREQVQTMRKVSAPGMVIFALTCSFAGFDWLMSLEPHWYSTIFGVYFFGGCLLSFLAVLILITGYLRRKSILNDTITIEHFHDLGKLIFAFIIFWGYIGFSQYFLIWYANIPEETIFYLERWEGTWKFFSLTLVYGHFAIPFLATMTRAARRNMKWLTSTAIWLLLMHWIDLFWIAMPVFAPDGIHITWMDISIFLGLGSFFLGIFWKHLSAHALVPVNDPALPASMEFSNV